MRRTTALDLEDRILLGLTALTQVYFDRDRFISDSDLLDVAEQFTTDVPYAADEDPATRALDDYDALVAALDERICEHLDSLNTDHPDHPER
jgi:hypothetical protein